MNNKSRIRRLAWWLAGIAIVAGGVFVAIRPRPVLVDVATVKKDSLEVTVDEDGTTRIRDRYVVSTPLSGDLQRIRYDVGDAVRSNKTVVARMEPTDPSLLDPRTVAQARVHVKSAERKLAAAKAEKKKADTGLSYAEAEMGRARQLRDQDATSDLEFDEKLLFFQYRTEEARVAAIAVEIAEHELELRKAALLLTDPDASDDADMELAITAPIDGRILRIYQESSAVLTAGEPLMEIGDPSDLEIVADVLSRDAVRISRADAVYLEQWGGERPLQGRVRLVEPSGFTKMSALGVEEQRVNVIIDLVDPPGDREQLGDNFRVDCRIVVWRSDQALQIPTSALFRNGDQQQVFKVEGDVARLTKVTIGKNNGVAAQVLEGLTTGDVVIVHPSDSLQDGTLIKRR